MGEIPLDKCSLEVGLVMKAAPIAQETLRYMLAGMVDTIMLSSAGGHICAERGQPLAGTAGTAGHTPLKRPPLPGRPFPSLKM